MQGSRNKNFNNYQQYVYSQKAALAFLKSRVDRLSQNFIKTEGIFENGIRFFFGKIYEKKSHKEALAKFSEIKNVLRQISDKNIK